MAERVDLPGAGLVEQFERAGQVAPGLRVDEEGGEVHTFILSLGPFRGVIRDYFMICDSYYEAIRTQTPHQIEAIDMGRRGLHNEGSEMLRERLSGKVEMDLQTARRLFTLICVLHIRG